MANPPNELKVSIREVWADNLEQEMGVLRDLVEKYPYLAMVCVLLFYSAPNFVVIQANL
jgi:hypothetical protein